MAGDTSNKGLDWEGITFEYITTKISYAAIAEKYEINMRTVVNQAKKYNWQKQRKKHRSNVANKALSKAANKEAKLLAKELQIADKITGVLNEALEDAKQFHRHIIQTRYIDGVKEEWKAEEKIFDKIDMKALKDAAQTLKLVEEMKRSMLGILTVQEKESIDINRERLAIDKAKNGVKDDEDEDTGVVVLPDIDNDKNVEEDADE